MFLKTVFFWGRVNFGNPVTDNLTVEVVIYLFIFFLKRVMLN